jgi:predicted ATPase
VRESVGQTLVATLAERLRDRRLLLVLDNCEYLLEGCAPFVHAILRACPEVHILATSREPLGVIGEVAWRVPSLPVLDPRRLPRWPELRQNAAVQLFAERAAAAQNQFALTEHNASALVRICHRLDGIPLALELAAARIEGLSAEQLASRLDAGFQLLTSGSRAALPRHQTLQATLDWSYHLLTERERRLFCRLSVFAGSWSVPAVEAMCSGGDIASENVLDLLLQLVRKSLVVAHDPRDGAERYRLLESLRQYARERLVEVGELQRLRRRHASYVLAFN